MFLIDSSSNYELISSKIHMTFCELFSRFLVHFMSFSVPAYKSLLGDLQTDIHTDGGMHRREQKGHRAHIKRFGKGRQVHLKHRKGTQGT